MNIKDIHTVEERAEQFFRDLEAKANEVIEGFEKRSKCVTDTHAKIMTRNANIFWSVLGVVVIAVGGFMMDTRTTMASKANTVTTDELIKSLKLEKVRTDDTYMISDSVLWRFYNDRFEWQLQTILKKE